MDRVRTFVAKRLTDLRMNMAEASRAMPRNHAYLQQFIHRGVPGELPEKSRRDLAHVLQCDESKLRSDVNLGLTNSQQYTESEGAEAPLTVKVEMDQTIAELIKLAYKKHGPAPFIQIMAEVDREKAQTESHPPKTGTE